MENTKIFSEEIMKPDFTLEGAHLVAASAGTGKTHNIQNIYARLIMEKGWRVSQIQVMTYTDAATKELRERLRTVLNDIQVRMNGGSCEGKDAERRNERADKLIAASRGETAAKRNAVELALLEFDSAAISTIHGFCSRALARYAFETRTPFSTEIEDNKIADLSRRTRDWWRRREELAPAEILPKLDFNKLRNYVFELGKKALWVLDSLDETTPNGFMLKCAADIVDAYEKDRANRSTQTFDDLLRAMREALRGEFGETFAAKLREEFKAALIDEFQDTDPVQYEIFQKVFLADEKVPVFFVGDPKQAIYAFRGGDIFTYRKATTSEYINNNKFYLDTNYRSTQRLMDAVNALFLDKPNGEEDRFTFGDSEIDYPLPIKADDKKSPDKKRLLVDGNDDPQPFRIISVSDKNQRFDVLAQEVVKTLTDYADILTPKDIAILVSSHINAQNIKDKLKKCNVPCAIQKPGNVFTYKDTKIYGHTTYKPSKLLRELCNVLLACAGNGGKKQIFTALLTPFFGLSPADLLAMDEDTLAGWIRKFKEIDSIWLKRGFGAAMSKIQEYGVRNGIGYRERLAADPDGERLLTDCGQIIELAIAATKEIGPSPEKMIEWLKKRVVNAQDEEDTEAYARQLESEDDAVKIMTMHVSKGLQFPVVFLPDCNDPVKTKSFGDAICYHDRNNGYQLSFTTLSENSGEQNAEDTATPEEQQVQTSEKQQIPEELQAAIQEATQEKLRLLYVAMTRAEQRTVALYTGEPSEPLGRLFANAKRNGAGEDSPTSPIKWINGYDLQEPAPLYVRADRPDLDKENEEPRAFDMRSKKGSYSSITPSLSDDKDNEDFTGGKDNDEQDNETAPENTESASSRPIFQIKGGANIGSCWHEILEKVPFDADEETLKEISSNTLKAYGFNPDDHIGGCSYLDITCGMLKKVLEREITTPDGSTFTLRDVSWNDRLSELEFNFSSAAAQRNTSYIAEILRSHWRDDASKKEFLDAVENWERSIPDGFINGFMDLVFRHKGYYYIVDWKSNKLGGDEDSFTEDGVRHEMAKHGYFFQYLLYAAVLHRWLKSLPGGEYSWKNNFGGIMYYFLRGVDAGIDKAVFTDMPEEGLLDEIGEVLGMEVK